MTYVYTREITPTTKIMKILIISKSSLMPLVIQLPLHISKQPPIHFLSAWISLHFLVFCKNGSTTNTLFFLVYFTQHNYFEIHQCYCIFQWFIRFYCLIIVCLYWTYHNVFIISFLMNSWLFSVSDFDI